MAKHIVEKLEQSYPLWARLPKTQALKSEAQKKLDTKKREIENQAGEKLKNLLGK